MTTSQPIELDTHSAKTETTCHAVVGHEDQLERAEVKDDSLPPQDGGSGAWLFLFGACVFEIVSWGKYLVEAFRYWPWANLNAQVSHTRGEFFAPTCSLMDLSRVLPQFLWLESCQT